MQGTTGKIVLVVLGVMLMLVFILPSGLRNQAGGDPVVGTLDGKSVRTGEVRQAGALLNYAAGTVVIRDPQSGQDFPLPTRVFGADVAQTLEKEPELFYLLLTEARGSGVRTSAQDVQSLLDNPNVFVLVEDPAQPVQSRGQAARRPVAFKDIPGQQVRDNVSAAVAAVIDVAQSKGLYEDFYKVSAPVLDYHLALENQTVGLKTVVFDARDYLAEAAEPDESAVRQQFEQFKNVPAGGDELSPGQNPFGFGYRLPNRVKFGFLALPVDAAANKIRRDLAAQDLRGRELALYRYWSDNRARFPVPPGSPATRPASQPTDEPTTQPDDQPDAAAQPSTEPATEPANESVLAADNPDVQLFLDQQTAKVNGTADEATWRSFLAVHDNVARTDIAEQSRELRTKVLKRMRDLLTSDYRAFDAARTAAGAGDFAAPQTALGVAVDDPSYLEMAADKVAEETGVRPAAASYGRAFYDRDMLADVAEVGPIATATIGAGQAGGIGFADYLLAVTEPLLNDKQKAAIEAQGALLKTYQPSLTIRDIAGSEYVFRVTDAAPASAAADLAEVEDRVRRDLRLKAGYEKASSAAEALATRARDAGSLPAAAETAGKTLYEPDPFVPRGLIADPAAFGAGPATRPTTGPADADEPAAPATLDRSTRLALADGIYHLLARPGERPIAVLPLQPAFRAVVAELDSVSGTWTDDQTLALRRVQVRQQLDQQALGDPRTGVDPIGAEFYDLARVRSRLGYVPKAKSEDE